MSEAVNPNQVLRLENITMQFGGVVAINNFSMEVNQGEIVALIGPNGAGKTTAFNCITGVYEPTNGIVYFHGEPIVANHPQGKMVKQYGGINGDLYKNRRPVVHTPDKITHMGIARTFQNIRLFKSQSAFNNVLIGTHLRRTSNMFTAAFRLNAKEEKAMREKAMNLLEIVGLADEADELATSLPYGKQRRLEIARALATDPTLLLLDEPAAGMNPQETDELGEKQIRPDGFHDRASYEPGHGYFRPDLCAGLRQADRRGHPGRDPEKPGRDRGLPGGGRRMSLLKVTDLVVSYGGIEALKGISFEVDQGQIVTLIGANGAGKSTTLRTISGLVPPRDGRIYFEGRDITDLNTQKIVETGIAMVPEGRRVFANLTVLENLRIGAYLRKDKEAIEEDINYVYDLFPRLKERSWQLAGTLSGGEQQMLAVGRAVMTRPKMIMMDEPSLGLAPLVVKDIFKIIRTLKETGMTVLLIEQNANAALHACDYAYVMETGRITTSGTGEELLASEAIQEAYLGKTNKG